MTGPGKHQQQKWTTKQMKQNFKTEFKPYLDTLKKDNTELKNRFNQDKFILRLRKKARQKNTCSNKSKDRAIRLE